MPVELRKRKAPAEPVPPPPSKKKNPVKAAVDKAKEVISGKKETSTNGSASSAAPAVGSVIILDGFGGKIETNDGEETTLKKLADASTSGVVLFTYPKASTPGCTKQACMFRDDYTPLTATGFAIYGLSRDSPKANTTFKTKQKLPYSLLCDTSASLIGAIGLKKAPSGTTRGVFVVDKTGKVLVSEAGGPDATVNAVRNLVTNESGTSTKQEVEPAATGSAKMDVDPVPTEPANSSTIAPTGTAVPATTTGDLKPVKTQESASSTAPVSDPIVAPTASSTDANANGAALTKEDSQRAEVATEVADSATAAKIDPATPNPV